MLIMLRPLVLIIVVLIIRSNSLVLNSENSTSIQKSNTNPSSVLLSSSVPKEKLVVVGSEQKYGNNGNSSSSNDLYDGVVTKKSRTGRRRRFRLKQSKSKRKSKRQPYFQGKITKRDRQGLNLDEQTDADSLRRKILTKLGSMDPLLCLPKEKIPRQNSALCGVSSRRQQHLKLSQSPQEEGNLNDLDPLTLMDDQNSVNNYFQIMQAMLPDTQGQSQKEKSKTQDKIQKSKNSTVKKKKRKSKASLTGFERDDNNADNSESSVSSSEEEESNESDQSTEELSEDDLEYYREKAEVEQMMNEEEFDVQHNWWDVLPNTNPYPIVEPQTENNNEESSSSMWPSMTSWRFPKGLGSFFGSMMPSMAWGFGKTPDVFQGDPFFQDFRSFNGRSLDSGGGSKGVSSNSIGSQRGLKWSFGKTDQLGKPAKKKRQQNKLKKEKQDKYLDQRKGINNIDDPVEKFQLAIEVGKQMDDPKQCDYVFNGCPFSYEEIVQIIESSKNTEIEPKEEEMGSNSASSSSSSESSEKKYEEFKYSYIPTTLESGVQMVNHTIPYNSEENLEISLKLLNSNERRRIPLATSKRGNKPQKMPAIEILEPQEDPELTAPSSSFQPNTAIQIPTQQMEKTEKTIYKTEVPEASSQKDEEIYIETTTKQNVKLQRKPKKKRRKQVMKNKRKQWGYKNGPLSTTTTTTTAVPIIYIDPEKLGKFPESHITNYHYYNSNPPPPPPQSNNNFYPTNPVSSSESQNPEKPKPSPEFHETHTTTKKSVEKPVESQEERISKPENRKLEHSSEERIIIRLPDSPNNNYYNLYSTPLPHLYNNYYPTTHQPYHFHQNYYRPQQSQHGGGYHQFQSPMMSPMYPQSPPPPSMYPLLPQTHPGMHNSMLSYFFGKK